MEIPRYLRYVFSSSEGKRRMDKRREIIEDMFNTIHTHTPEEISSKPNMHHLALYRGTLLGWVVLGTLLPDSVLTSGTSYDSSRPHATLDFGYANTFPMHEEEKSPDIKRALNRMRRREGLHIRSRTRRELVRKLSKRVTIQADPRGTYPPEFTLEEYLRINNDLIRIPIGNLTQWSSDQLRHRIGIDPVSIAQQLANLS